MIFEGSSNSFQVYETEAEITTDILALVKEGQCPTLDSLRETPIYGWTSARFLLDREITEETGVTPDALMPDSVFSNPGRDPRGWVISNAFVSVISEENINAHGGDDAAEAKWFDVSFTVNDKDVVLVLRSEESLITAKLRIISVQFGYPHFEIIDSGGLAFDHAEIIACALYRLRCIIEDFDIIFDFLPEKFTLSSLQRVQEAILDTPLLPANFRRKASPYIEETDEYLTGAGHRPAKLFRRKQGG